MSSNKTGQSKLHPRNKHQARYDFESLIAVCPELKNFVSVNKYGGETIDFSNPLAVKTLNKALLIRFYNVSGWDIPDGYLCPPIPGRADYLHYAADLLASSTDNIIPTGKKIKILDIGVGSNCIYPIIGASAYGWSFVGAEVDQFAIRHVRAMIDANPSLNSIIEIRHQPNITSIFKNIIRREECFDLTICNPPFHASAAEALAGSQRKVRNLGDKNYRNPVLNFGGKNNELWTSGGELGFIEKMIVESVSFKEQCLWFTTLVSKSENLGQINKLLEQAGVAQKRTIEMATGNKVTRIVAWTFLSDLQKDRWVSRWKK